MNTYNHHLGDYAKDTKNLSPLEHGCYRLLLDYNYATEKSIPNDVSELYRIVGAATSAERKAVDKVAERFFPVNGDGRRHNKRAQEEIEKYHAKVEHNREVGRRGGRPRHNPKETRTVLSGLQLDNPKETLATNHEPSNSKAKGANAPLSEPGVPTCPHDSLIALYAKHLPMLTQPRLWSGHRAEAMRSRWRECAKRNAVWPGYTTVDGGLAFWDQFFSDVSKAKPLTDGIPRGDGSCWKPDLPWLLKAENFAKVIEGKYHR